MQTVVEVMSAHHKICDDAFATAEEVIAAGNWDDAEEIFGDFRTLLARHFHLEEESLFPALLEVGGPGGPVDMMLMEHVQMDTLVGQMTKAVERHDAKEYNGLSETLLIVMQQHNLKEEQILYPLADQYIPAPKREDILDNLR